MTNAFPGPSQRLADQADLVEDALRRASEAALGPAAVEVGAQLETVERELRALREALEEDASSLLGVPVGALPGTGEVVAAVHIGGDLQQLAELAGQIGEIASARRARGPLPEGLRTPLLGLGDLALAMVAGAAGALRGPSAEIVADLHEGLNGVAQRQRLLYERLLDGAATDRTDTVDTVLLACCFARCATHAASAARYAALFAGRC
ncbi:hypothetical protein [Streptomyces sp. CB01881]|uniref:hypothetical protein n=1 Tax=Streptomyces sp. CB01881 TaxID=2078691 RepID=UPI000CDCB3F0|nr:hypothetical protein [Streptomyces sp. CB01881]AUY47748.1 hypothetical protein C2142_00815 [Streptomyces sp. CB01881]TYC76225.1 hypothetical protein EH183_00820 [Streptomyces sp. CB01881]